VPCEILDPVNAWADKAEFDRTGRKRVGMCCSDVPTHSAVIARLDRATQYTQNLMMCQHHDYVYILASQIGGTLYIGVSAWKIALIEKDNPNWDDLYPVIAVL
jgi:hypothetical protein